jgi:hypothetical protein
MTYIRTLLVIGATLFCVARESTFVLAGEVVRGPVRVCQKPMLAGSAALANPLKPGPGPDVWAKLAERQAEEAKYCYQAGDIELVEKGAELDVGLGTKCTEWRAKAKGDEVYVVIGSRDRAWGRCP